jgi:hypothetical protein
MYAATPPNEPHHCILTHFNNCYFSKAQIVCSLKMVFHTETCRSFLMSILMQIYNCFKAIQFSLLGKKTLIRQNLSPSTK